MVENTLNSKFAKSSVRRQKGESQDECFKKAKHAKISEKQTFLTPPSLLPYYQRSSKFSR